MKGMTLAAGFLSSTFLLSGCHEQNEVTEDMLIGAWQCERIDIQKSSFNVEKGQFNDYEVDVDEIGKTRMVSYVKVGEHFFIKEVNKPIQAFKFKVKTLFEDSIHDPLARTQSLNAIEYHYLSNTEHQLNFRGELITYAQANNNVLYGTKYKSSYHCIKTDLASSKRDYFPINE